jgi:hypothetical protein
LYAALAGLGALGGMGAAEAVNVSGEGLGQVLIYPYYTVRHTANGGGYNTLLSVVNSTGSAKAVKVRFLEGKNSREVLDFNLFLSKNDVWTATVVETADGAAMTTTDQSCILPNSLTAVGHAFVNYAYIEDSDDGADQSLDRTREGYVEIIEMATYASDSTTSINVTHKSGVPPGCADNSDSQASSDAQTGTGGLFGALTLINVLDGSAYSTDAVALANFNRDQVLYFNSGSILPNLGNATPLSVVINNGNAVVTQWFAGVDAVSATMMHNAVLNEYATEPSILANTDWVITMPTKNAYVSVGTGTAVPPFQRNFNGNAGACDDVRLQTWDREEKTPSTPGTFSPPPPQGKANSLCWEANVINFKSDGVLGSKNNKQISLAAGQVNGWAQLTFLYNDDIFHRAALAGGPTTTVNLGVNAQTASAFAATYHGLPVVGFAVQAYNNNILVVNGKNVQSTYGADFVHRYKDASIDFDITPVP